MDATAPALMAAIGTDVEQATIRRIAWRFMPVLALSYLLSFLDRVNVSFAALTANRDLHLSASAYGWGAGIFFVGYFLFEFPSNILMARVGARLWLPRIMVSWGVVSGLMALTVGPWSFYLVRFLLGVAEAGLFPGLLLFMTYWFPRRYRARYIGLMLVGMPASSLIGAPISGLLLGLDGLLGLHGWQWMYLLEALPTVLLGLFLYFLLTDRPAEATWLSSEQRAWLAEELAREEPPSHGGGLGFFAMMRNVRVLFYALVFFNVTSASYGLGLWLPQIVKNFGLTNTQTGFVAALPYLTGTLAILAWGRIADLWSSRLWAAALPAFLAAVALVVSMTMHSPMLEMLALCVATLGIYGIKGPFLSLITESFGSSSSAGGIAMVSALGNLSGFLPPYIVGWIKDATGHFTWGLLFLAVLSVLGGLQLLFAGAFERRMSSR